MAEGYDRMLILGRRSLEIFVASSGEPAMTISLPQARSGWSLARIGGIPQLILVDGPSDAPDRVFVIGQEIVTADGNVALPDVAWSYEIGSDRDWAITDSTLWRLDRDLVLHECAIDAGRSAAATCRAATPPPASLDKSDVGSVVSVEDGTLIHLPDRVVLFDRRERPQQVVTGLQVGAGGQLFSLARRAYFWEGPGQGLYQYNSDGGFDVVLPEVIDLERRTSGLFAATPDGWHSIDRDAGQAGALALNGTELRASTLTALGQVTGLAPDGQGLSGTAGAATRAGFRFPSDTVALAAGGVSRDDGETRQLWWSQAIDGSVRADWLERCRLPRSALDWPDALFTPTPMEAVTAQGTLTCRRTQVTGLTLGDGERILRNGRRADGVELLETSVATYAVDPGTFAVEKTADWQSSLREDSADAEAKARLLNAIVDIEGVSYLSPPRIEPGPNPEQIALRMNSADRAVHTGGRRLQDLRALDLNWLTWNRSDRSVQFGATTVLSPADAIRGGRFLPDVPGRGAYLGGDRFALLNAHGLWHVTGGTSVVPVVLGPMAAPVGFAHGRFLFENDGIDARSGQMGVDSGQHQVVFDALVITETLRRAGVSATYRVSGRDVPVSSGAGFLFDRRSGVTARDGTPMLATQIGLVPARGFGEGLALPEGTTAVDIDGNVPVVQTALGWLRLDGTAWQPASPPRSNRLLAEESGRRWQRTNGQVEINAITPGDDWRAARSGLAFEADRLIALSGDGAGPVIVTGAGTFAAETIDALAPLRAPDAADPGATVLDALASSPGKTIIWAETGAGRMVWDRTADAWRTPRANEDPWQTRMPIDRADLRVTFAAGRAEVSARVEDLDGSSRLSALSWRAGQPMPFDAAQAFVVEDDRIWLATGVGLRRLRWMGAGATSETLYSGTNGQTPRAFQRVGRPDAAPQRLLAEAGGACLEMAGSGAAPSPCSAPQVSLAERHVWDSALWHWRKSDTDLSGDYLDGAGNTLLPVAMQPGRRWPHDRLRRVLSCDGQRIEIWADHDVVALATNGEPGQLARLDGVEGLLCQGELSQLGQGATLPAGTYAFGAAGAWRLDAGQWAPATAAEAVRRRARGDLPWDAARMRVAVTGGRLVAERRTLADTWVPLGWANGRIATDTVVGLSALVGGVQFLTPAGVFDWDVARPGLNADGFILRTTTSADGFAGCAAVHVEARDGSVQAVPALGAGVVEVMCKDGQVLRGDVASRVDEGSFAAVDEPIDPERVLVEVPDWTWTRENRAAGPSISIGFKTEEVVLSGGRLSVDDYAGLAAPFDGRIEILTQAAGWWRSPGNDLSLKAVERPPNETRPQEVTALWSDLAEGQPMICAEGADKVHMDAAGAVTRAPFCRAFRGRDKTWTWFSGDAGAVAEGVALNGVAMQRRLSEGRFADLHVAAAPMPESPGAERLFVPTRAGVMVLGLEGPEGQYVFGSSGVLAAQADGTPTLVARTGPVALGRGDVPSCKGLGKMAALLPEDATPLRVMPVAADSAVVVLDQSGERRQILTPCDATAESLEWTVPARVEHRDRYRAYGPGSLSPRLFATFRPGGGLDVADAQGKGRVLADDLPGDPIAQVVAPDARAVMVATSRGLYRLDTDRALSLVARTPETVSAPPAAFPLPAEPQIPARPPVQDDTEGPRDAVGREPAEVQPGPAAPPVPEMPVLDNREPVQLTSDQVMEVQRALVALGHDAGRADGISGPRTRRAIRDWQADAGHEPTGTLTELQLSQLQEALP